LRRAKGGLRFENTGSNRHPCSLRFGSEGSGRTPLDACPRDRRAAESLRPPRTRRLDRASPLRRRHPRTAPPRHDPSWQWSSNPGESFPQRPSYSLYR
jgi:hypothetical protein